MQLIRQLAPAVVDLEPTQIASLARSVGGVPLALRLIGRTLAKQAESGQASLVQKRFEDFHEVRESLHSAIAVSTHALSDHARAALYALSVLPAKPGCFSQEAALAITGCDPSTLYVLQDLTLLENCGPKSYRMHQVIAGYSREQLESDQAAFQATYMRLFQYAVNVVQEYENDYQRLDQESQTIMAALEAAVKLRNHEALIQIMLCFAPFLSYRGWNQDAERFLFEACAVAREERRLSKLPRLLFFLAEFRYKLAAYEEAMKAQLDGLLLASQLQNEEMTAAFMAQLAWQMYLFGNYGQAEGFITEGMKLFASTSHPNPRHLCTLLRAQGSLAWARGDYQASKQAYLQGLQVMQDLDERDWDHLSVYYCFLGWIEGMRGRYEQAEHYFQQSLAAAESYLPDFWPFVQGLRCQVILLHHPSRELREDLGQAIQRALELTAIGYSIYVWKALALLEIILHNYDKAEKYVGYAIERAEQFRSGSRVGELLTIRAQIEMARGHFSQAAKTLDEALPLVKGKSPVEEIAGTLITQGELFLQTRQFEKAEMAFAEALNIAPAEHLPLLALGEYGQARTAAARGDKRKARRLGEAALGVFRQIRHYRVKEVEEWLSQYRHPWLSLFTFGRRRAKEVPSQPDAVPTGASA